jgi:hypothetical protein
MLDQIPILWATEFGPKEQSVSQILASASVPFCELLLRVAPSLEDRHKVCPIRLGRWLAEHRGKAAAGWRLECRTSHNQAAWRIVETPAEPAAETSPLIAPPLVALDPESTEAELLHRNVRLSLLRQGEILREPVDPDDPRSTRLKAEVAATTLSSVTKVEVAKLQAPNPHGRRILEEMIERVAEWKKKNPRPPEPPIGSEEWRQKQMNHCLFLDTHLMRQFDNSHEMEEILKALDPPAREAVFDELKRDHLSCMKLTPLTDVERAQFYGKIIDTGPVTIEPDAAPEGTQY